MPDEAFDLLTGMSAQSIIAVSCVKCKEFSYFFIFSLGLDVAVVCIKLFQSYVVKLLHCVKLLFLKGFLSFFLSFFLIRGGTRSLCMPVLRPASQAGPMPQGRD